MPTGGTFDSESFLLANALLGSNEGPAIEIPLMGGSFECVSSCSAAVVGAECGVTVTAGENLKGGLRRPQSFASQCRLDLSAGDALELGPRRRGARVYLCLGGGISPSPVLGSVSGIPVTRDFLWATDGETWRSVAQSGFYGRERYKRLATPPDSLRSRALRFLPGPQAEFFDLDGFSSTAFTVSHEIDRKGLRLNGACRGRKEEIASEPACFGAIQVTPSGAPIVVGPDGPTIGGYPKIAVVIGADLDRLAQLAPGDELRFALVSAKEAKEAWAERETRLGRVVRNLLAARVERF